MAGDTGDLRRLAADGRDVGIERANRPGGLVHDRGAIRDAQRLLYADRQVLLPVRRAAPPIPSSQRAVPRDDRYRLRISSIPLRLRSFAYISVE